MLSRVNQGIKEWYWKEYTLYQVYCYIPLIMAKMSDVHETEYMWPRYNPIVMSSNCPIFVMTLKGVSECILCLLPAQRQTMLKQYSPKQSCRINSKRQSSKVGAVIKISRITREHTKIWKVLFQVLIDHWISIEDNFLYSLPVQNNNYQLVLTKQ